MTITKLLIDHTDDTQSINTVREGGEYKGAGTVIWDERINGPMGDVTPGGLIKQGALLVQDAARQTLHDAAMLAKRKLEKIKQLEIDYDTAIHADIVHDTKTYVCDEQKIEVISRFSSLGSVPAGMYIEAKDGEQVSMTLTELRALGMAIAERGISEHQNFTTKKAAVNAATTIAEVDAVVY